MSAGAAVGFVGLGAMGTPLASAIRDDGHELFVHDRDPDAVGRLVESGAVSCSSPADVADRAEIVFVSLPTPDVVRAVALGEDGLARGKAIRTCVDLSTTGSVVAAEVAAGLAAHGINVLDAPVSGGVSGARARTLAVMAAGDEEVFRRIRPLLELFGRDVFLVGATPGQGQTAKLLNNLLSATALLITSEAVAFGTAAGLEAATLLDVFNASSGRNTATSQKFPEQVLTQRFASGFRLELMAKDVELCLSEARAQHFPMLVGSLVQQLWTLAAAQSDEQADHTEIARLVEQWTENGPIIGAETGSAATR